MIGSPVTAQRTKSPGASTWNSPSRKRTLASPLRPSSLSNRFILLRPRRADVDAAYRWRFARASAAGWSCARNLLPASEQRPLASAARARLRARRGARRRLGVVARAAGEGLRVDVAVGELDV